MVTVPCHCHGAPAPRPCLPLPVLPPGAAALSAAALPFAPAGAAAHAPPAAAGREGERAFDAQSSLDPNAEHAALSQQGSVATAATAPKSLIACAPQPTVQPCAHALPLNAALRPHTPTKCSHAPTHSHQMQPCAHALPPYAAMRPRTPNICRQAPAHPHQMQPCACALPTYAAMRLRTPDICRQAPTHSHHMRSYALQHASPPLRRSRPGAMRAHERRLGAPAPTSFSSHPPRHPPTPCYLFVPCHLFMPCYL